MKTNIKTIVITSVLVLASVLTFTGLVNAATFTQLTGVVNIGETSTNVTSLQTFLASNSSIYPQGTVTGYFGPLTKSAVMNFQNAFGISQVGRVGPQTLAKINGLIASGANLVSVNGGTGTDVNAPMIYSLSSNTSRNGATVSWVTNEPAKSQVYYSASPFQLMETNGSGEGTIIGGSRTGDTSSMQNNNNLGLSNLQSGTMYYYMVESTDAAGNVQYTWPTTFTTQY